METEAAVDAYIAAWNERDAATRRSLLERALADGCELVGPTGTFRGRDAVEGLVLALQARMQDAAIARTGPMDGSRFAWQVLGADGTALLTGTDVVEVDDDGRLRRIEVEL